MRIRTKLTPIAVALAALAAAGTAMAQHPAAPDADLLTLDRAVELAVQDNATLKSAEIDIDRAGDRLAATRTKRFPSVNLYVLSAQNLTPINFRFQSGAFGTYPGIGPVPSTDTSISTPRQPTVTMINQLSQPLSQLHQIRLGIAMAQVDVELAREKASEKRKDLVASVKEAYFAILQTQSALETTDETIRMYAELDRLTDGYIIQQVVLRSDSLDVKARLAKSQYDASVLRDQLATQKERLNVLLGRDVETQFRVSPALEYTPYDVDLVAARGRALAERPEVRQARLNVERAGYDRRMKKSEYIPEISLNVSHVSMLNFDSILPRQVATVGVTVNWEVFDWGRKHHELEEKDRALEQADLALRDSSAKVVADVNEKYRTLGQTQRLLRVARMRLDACREDVRVTTERYRAQVALLKDALQAQTSLAEANTQYQQALLSFWTARADFEKAIGGEQP
jgi:outer membrane protein TolC